MHEDRGTAILSVWSGPEQFQGRLVVSVGEHVVVSDAFLRT